MQVNYITLHLAACAFVQTPRVFCWKGQLFHYFTMWVLLIDVLIHTVKLPSFSAQ